MGSAAREPRENAIFSMQNRPILPLCEHTRIEPLTYEAFLNAREREREREGEEDSYQALTSI